MGPSVDFLIEAGLVEGKTVTSWPSLRTDLKNAGGKAAAAMDALNAMIGEDSPDDHIKMLSVG